VLLGAKLICEGRTNEACPDILAGIYRGKERLPITLLVIAQAIAGRAGEKKKPRGPKFTRPGDVCIA
jgi:hypothetical protein